MKTNTLRIAIGFLSLTLLTGATLLSSPDAGNDSEPWRSWSLEDALQILTQSPWARQETHTRVVGGIGSGILGEKEIYNTFYVRLLSAELIRQAYARLTQIQHGYDNLSEEEKREIDALISPGLNLDVSRWFVVAVSFRSNDPDQQRRVDQFLRLQTTETMKNRALLATAKFPQLQIQAYYPPNGDGVGAKFVFPRNVNGTPVVNEEAEEITFELEIPGTRHELRATFSTLQMMAKGDPPSGESTPASIRNYPMPVMDKITNSENQNLNELINPFPTQSRRGRLHGSFYEFHRNDNFDARNFFDPVGQPLPEYKRNQFGLTLGTSISGNTEVLGSFDGLRIIQGSTLLSHVPTPAMKAGDFSRLSKVLTDPMTGRPLKDNRIPEERIHPVARRLLHLIPDPNRQDPERNFVNNDPIVRNQNTFSFKLDHHLDPSKVSLSYDLADGDKRLAHPLPSFGSQEQERNQDFSLGLNTPITNRLLADLQLRFVRNLHARLSENANQPGLVESLGISGIRASDATEEGYPDFTLPGYASFGDRASPVTSVFNGYFLDGSFSYALANHSLRAGVEAGFRQINNNRSGGAYRGRFIFNGHYSGDPFADFLLGLPDTAYRGMGSERADLRGKNLEFFFRDTWRIKPELDFGFGLNYSYHEPYRSVHPNVSGFFPLLFEPPLDGEIVVAGSERAKELGLTGAGSNGLVLPDLNDWAPQLSLSYRPYGNNWLVLRSSYSIFSSPIGPGYFLSFLGRNYPFYYLQSAQASVTGPGLNLSHPFETLTPAETDVRGIEQNLNTPYNQRWSLSIQNEIARQWSLQASYTGSKGTGLPRVLSANVPFPGPGAIQPRRSNPNFGRFSILSAGGSSSGHFLDLTAERRFADGLSLRSGLSWNRLLNDTYQGHPSNPRNLRAERALAEFMPARRFFLNYILDLPLDNVFPSDEGWADWLLQGWRLSGITHIQDGTPFTVLLRGDANNDGVSADRPDRIGPGRVESSQRSIDFWFNTSDFTSPRPYTFGDAGRNILIGPGYQNWDVSLIKRTRFSDGDQVEFRVELFNAFNQVNFDEPDAVFGTSVFGKIFGAGRAREIELALKYSF